MYTHQTDQSFSTLNTFSLYANRLKQNGQEEYSQNENNFLRLLDTCTNIKHCFCISLICKNLKSHLLQIRKYEIINRTRNR